MEVILSYPTDAIGLMVKSAQEITDDAITLTHVDTTNGTILIHSRNSKATALLYGST